MTKIEKSAYLEVHDMLYGKVKEINEIVLEQNEVENEVIVGQSHNESKDEQGVRFQLQCTVLL